MNECTIIEINGKFQIGEILDSVESRASYEAMAKEDGIKLYRTDGNTPKWADSLVDRFNDNFESHKEFILQYAYVIKSCSEINLIGLVSKK